MRVLVVSHDPGGAEILSSWVRRNTNNQYNYILGGPAKSIFEKKIKALVNIDMSNLYSEIKNHNMVITGTSQNSNLEKLAIQIAREENINVVTFLDYWANFYTRFKLDGNLLYPNEIWVTDEVAHQNAKNELPGATIILKNNPYLMDLMDLMDCKKKISNTHASGVKILYACQPYDENGDTDIKGLDFFLKLLRLKKDYKEIKVKIRLHPLENFKKYEEIINNHSGELDISVGCNNFLEKDLSWADHIVGMHTNVLGISIELGLSVYFCIPHGWDKCAIPHKKIKNFVFF